MSATHGRYTSLDSKQTSQWNAANMPTPQLPMHRVLCSLVHSYSITHLNYWNMCRLGCAIMLSATLLAPTRYETVSKHHAATNVTIITYIKEIVKYWGNWEIPRKIRKYRSNSWWRHQLEIFSALQAFCAGNSPVTGEFPAQRPVTRSSHVFFWPHLNNCLANNREAGDLRRHHTHHAGIVMWCTISLSTAHPQPWYWPYWVRPEKVYDILKTTSNQFSP